MTIAGFGSFLDNHALKKPTVLLLKIFYCGTFVSGMLQMLLEELKASAVFLDKLSPRLDSDDVSRPFCDKAPLAIWSTFNLVLGKIVVGV